MTAVIGEILLRRRCWSHEPCGDCLVDAIPFRDPRELTTEEGFRLIDQVRAFGARPPLLVFTGGDPMRRPDLADAMFVGLRDAEALVGKCGRCQFRSICGGSRSRADAATGAVMASDPLCVFEPGPEVESPVPVVWRG